MTKEEKKAYYKAYHEANKDKIKVYQKPVIGLISSGNELVDASEAVLPDGKIRDSNKAMLQAFLAEANHDRFMVKDYGCMRDSGQEIDEIMVKATEECDIVVTSGGVSMGKKDLIKPYLEARGQVFFGRLNMKPGKPTTFGKIGNCLVFSLPGNPVSCFVTF